MTNYYEILGIDQDAGSAQIKAAFKRLAMEYHPDRNPGNKHAEEVFKIVNEAYHILSDPLKKQKYDARLNPQPAISPEEWRDLNRRKHTEQHRQQQPYYVVDKEYYKNQALAFLAFIVVAGFCFGVMNFTQYLAEQKRVKLYYENRKALKLASTLFTAGQFDDAFTMINTLGEKDPLEVGIYYTRDSLVGELRKMAREKFDSKDFSSATRLYLVLKNQEQPTSYETLRKISMCQYYLGNYTESLQAMKHLHNQEPNNLELAYSIGMINLEKLENPQEALRYFTFGKELFKENLIKIYGASFEIVMNPADAPDIYAYIFHGRARANITLNNFEEAVTDCNWAIYLRPNLGEPYKLRAIANAGNKKFKTVCADLADAKKQGATEIEILERKYCR